MEFLKSKSPWEDLVSYSRACKVGNVISVSGTTAIELGEIVAPGNAYKQTLKALEIIEKAILHFGGAKTNITRTRIYVTDITEWEAVGRAHREFMDGHTPACTMVEVRKLIDPKLLVEIEADAILY
ncbi:MAG: enamine deaminase RidA (YjgF/YER057c/UK114 family) [Luteibaculaceae bacterium]|jgi:enamine deaminase RidA (YjgF/YER057c/UK114 family)